MKQWYPEEQAASTMQTRHRSGHSTTLRPLVAFLFAAMLTTILSPTSTASLEAQTPDQLRRQAEQQLGRPLTDQEILERLRQSGMSPAEVRQELQRRGQDPRAADAYLRVLEGRTDRVPSGSDPVPLLQILAERDADLDPRRFALDTTMVRPRDAGPPIFGRELFRRATTQFEPVSVGPVPPDYRVGPGDELVLVITGGVELAYQLNVSREGWVVIPDVGRVMVNGRTMEGVRDVLFQRLSQVYSGIQRGPDATTFFDVTLGRLRVNEIFVIGEVERPASYPVSSLGTVLTALYYAGGPARTGSFREAVVNRGGETVARVDLYDYLVRGGTEGSVRLEHGDIVFVPVAERRVDVSGAVIRPGIYEFRPGEDLRDVLRFAGGVEPRAELRRVQIERVLPVEERAPGRDRAILDVPVGRLDDPATAPIPLREGDRITVFAVLDEVDNEVQVSGGVWRPGTYAVSEGTRIWDVIERAGGLLPDVVEGRAQIQRLQDDWTRRLIPVPLLRDEAGRPIENPALQGRDEVYVYAARNLREDRQVSIGGWVREPGVYPFIEEMTVADLILQAGGLRTGAYLQEAEVSRVVMAQERSENLTESFQVPLDSALVFDRSRSEGGRNPSFELSTTRAAEFELHNLDAVYVRRAPGFEPQEGVVITGEVAFPGPYSISGRRERLSDLVERAGGLTSEAYPEGFQLWRLRDEDVDRESDPARARDRLAGLAGVSPDLEEGVSDQERMLELEEEIEREQNPDRLRRLQREMDEIREREQIRESERRETEEEDPVVRTRVGIDLIRVMQDPDSPANVLIHPNDSIHVPGFIPTVDVRGAVAAPTKVLYRPGAGFNYYIRQAGGYLEEANERRVRLQFANGEVATRGRRFLLIGGGIARPDPGSVITVPEREPRPPLEISQIVALASTSVSALATLIIALTR
jgi:protein involved in polysaccharide export with SLBB domain